MSRKEFMERLAYLLQDMPEDEKTEALQYYYDYFDDAGEDNEPSVIGQFGSPEKVAAIIRSEMDSNLKEGGEFTERGYHDSRFKDPNLEIANILKLPEPTLQKEFEQKPKEPDLYPQERTENAPRTSRFIKIILWIILICTIFPLIIGISKGALHLVGGIFSVIATLTIALGAVTIALLLAGIGVLIASFTLLFVNPLSAIALFGCGIALLGVGFLLLALCALYYGKFIPFLVRFIMALVHSLFRRRSKGGAV